MQASKPYQVALEKNHFEKLKTSRRQFIVGSAVGGVALTTLANGKLLASEKQTLSIIQGFTNSTSTQLNILSEDGRPLHFQVIDESRNPLSHQILAIHDRSFSAAKTYHLLITGLALGVQYELSVLDDQGNIIDHRFFQALDLSRTDARFAVASCMHDSFWRVQDSMWSGLLEQSPDLIFLIGDTVYVDSEGRPDEEQMWRRFVEARLTLPIYRSEKLTPVLATWDDHDYGLNNSDREFRLKNYSRDNFLSFFAQTPNIPTSSANGLGQIELEEGPGVSRLFRAFGQRFFLMDDRTFRSPPNARSNEAHWGKQQEDWLFNELGRDSSHSWILNGSQFFGEYLGKESFATTQPNNFRYVLKELSKIDTTIGFIAGDIHYSEVMAIEPEILGYSTLEVVSSGIHSFLIPFRNWIYSNPRRLQGANEYNFSILQSTPLASGGGVDVEVRAYGSRARTLYRHSSQIKR